MASPAVSAAYLGRAVANSRSTVARGATALRPVGLAAVINITASANPEIVSTCGGRVVTESLQSRMHQRDACGTLGVLRVGRLYVGRDCVGCGTDEI